MSKVNSVGGSWLGQICDSNNLETLLRRGIPPYSLIPKRLRDIYIELLYCEKSHCVRNLPYVNRY